MSAAGTIECAEVGVATRGTCRSLELRRPAALNALTLPMVDVLRAALDAAEADPGVASVLLTGAGGRAFCAGGDIRAIYDSLDTGRDVAGPFWRTEYELLLRIEAFAKPVVVLMDGLVMGGGVGLGMHASHRIVTERTRLAMPEVGIGFIPDVGATWRLPKAPSHLGRWLALTGEAVGPADAILAGLGDAMIASAELDTFREALSELAPEAGPEAVDALVARFASRPEPGALAPHRALIDAAFSAPTLANVTGRLAASAEPFAERSAQTIAGRSPTSLHVTWRLLELGAEAASLRECLSRELRAALRIMRHPDFREGVRAAVVDKDRKPRWQPFTEADAREWDAVIGGAPDAEPQTPEGAPR